MIYENSFRQELETRYNQRMRDALVGSYRAHLQAVRRERDGLRQIGLTSDARDSAYVWHFELDHQEEVLKLKLQKTLEM